MSARDDTDAVLDGILAQWHQWAQTSRHVRGFNGRSLVAGEYRTSRQYDDENGALDDALDERRMKQVDFEVSQMADPFRSAIYANARALVVGCAVFVHPRLPADREERQRVIVTARVQLVRRLVSAGVL